MIYIFGRSKEYEKHEERLPNHTCSHCSEHNTVYAVVFASYFHVWYIPFFPLPKRVVTVCSHCKAYHETSELDPKLAQRCKAIKSQVKTPLKYWSISIVILLILVFIALVGLGVIH